MGSFTGALGIPVAVGTSFAALTISVFALTTLDTSARLGRYAFQEFFEGTRYQARLSGRGIATAITVASSALLAMNKGSTMTIWPLFGAANQMLAALALLSVSAYLSHRAVNNGFVLIPAVVMFTLTLSAIGWLIVKNLSAHNYVLVIIAFILGGAALYIALLSIVRRRRATPQQPTE
jgi:carbon starvation protein